VLAPAQAVIQPGSRQRFEAPHWLRFRGSAEACLRAFIKVHDVVWLHFRLSIGSHRCVPGTTGSANEYSSHHGVKMLTHSSWSFFN
jgi:hypothetical protein